jgi:hypothetical protein
VTIDHLVSTTILVAVILIFVGLANQTLNSAIIYQRHANLATRCSSLLDSMLLSSGVPSYWGTNESAPTVFGLQDPESLKNELSSFSLMRLRSGTEPIYYSKTSSYYSNTTIGSGDSLLEPLAETVNYTAVSELLGTNGTYGFQLTLTPTITVSISEVQDNPLKFSVNAQGTGSPLSNGTVNYCLIIIDVQGSYPAYSLNCGTAPLDNLGSALLNFSGIDGSSRSFALLAYAYLPGLVGMGYYKQVTDHENSVIPLVFDVEDGDVILAHSNDIDSESSPADLKYNATFLSLSEDFDFASNTLQNSTGQITSGLGHPYGVLTIPEDTLGILAVTYRKDSTAGISLMPWGIGPLSFPITFGESPTGKEWVATTMQQVLVDKVAYQAVLSLWSLEGYEVIGQ